MNEHHQVTIMFQFFLAYTSAYICIQVLFIYIFSHLHIQVKTVNCVIIMISSVMLSSVEMKRHDCLITLARASI
jgi:hypothetical protein